MVPQSAALVEACLSNVEIVEKKTRTPTKIFSEKSFTRFAYGTQAPYSALRSPNVFQGTEFRAHRKPEWQVTARPR
jgi:hypothetical protein